MGNAAKAVDRRGGQSHAPEPLPLLRRNCLVPYQSASPARKSRRVPKVLAKRASEKSVGCSRR